MLVEDLVSFFHTCKNKFFHGSPACFDQLERRDNIRVDENDKIRWDGIGERNAIFLTDNPLVALTYTGHVTHKATYEIDMYQNIEEQGGIVRGILVL